MNGSEFVTLKSGPTLPVAAVQFALELEDRGRVLRVDGDALIVGPRDRITDRDREAIRRWRQDLIAIATYEAPLCA